MKSLITRWKTRRVLSVVMAVAMACQCLLAESSVKSLAKFNVDMSSAALYLEMARNAQAGDMPLDADWEKLFASTAYKALLDNIHWDKDEFRSNVRNAFEIVYDPSSAEQCDSIVRLLDDMDNISDNFPFFVSTAYSIKNRLGEYSALMSSVDVDSIVCVADSMARDLVPGRGLTLEAQASPVYFIVWDLECRNLSSGVYLDVNSFFHGGLQTAIEGLAHEIHHFYLGPLFESVYAKDINDGAAIALAENMREGVADIINKKHMPLESLEPYGDNILKIYNDDYLSSPKVLAELDSLTCGYLDKAIPAEVYRRSAIQCAHFGGHTTGDFMVFLIRDQLGMEAVVESLGDLDRFVCNYNKAAEKAGTYVFSDRFTRYICDLSKDAKR